MHITYWKAKKQHPEYKTVLHPDQGAAYASKNYNDLPGTCKIIHSVSRAGTPAGNAVSAVCGMVKMICGGNCNPYTNTETRWEFS